MKVYVVFIGGYKSSPPDMELWLASARKQRDDVVFDACPYPEGAGYKDTQAVAGFEKQFDEVIKKIEGSAADKIFIVGHSSGCAIANEVNSRLKGDHKNVTLVDLDGFTPSADQVKGAKTQVWSAEGGKGHSLNWSKRHKIYPALHATQTWSLHFSLVNTAATDAITRENYKSKGYAGCFANLCWLPKKE
jgi:hypothetical protein